jgi:solute carrier family 25 S-adenosylmethionine transporter 26
MKALLLVLLLLLLVVATCGDSSPTSLMYSSTNIIDNPLISFKSWLVSLRPRASYAASTSTQAFQYNTAVVRSTLVASSIAVDQSLTYMQTLTAGAVSRAIAQSVMHPANTFKTILQLKHNEKIMKRLTPSRLLRGVDAQFLFAIPHGAVHFFVIDQVKLQLSKFMPSKLDFLSDFSSSSISTVICSIVSTPQMVLTDRLMAGVYPSFPIALRKILRTEGIKGFYTGWWPALAQKIPSYGLTWMFFQQLKRGHETHFGTKPTAQSSFGLGAVAAAAATSVMIPMDTIKTRLVCQCATSKNSYKGIMDCFYRVAKEEGIQAFYKSLPPRLVSVVPMIAIQYGVYEYMKVQFQKENFRLRQLRQASHRQQS